MKTKIRNIKEEIKGITIVTLIVTIIVLLILAGVAINLSIGENGIFKRAKEGTKIYQNASGNEKIELNKVINYIDDYNNGKNKEDEEEKLSEVEEAIKNGTVYKENTTIYDEYSNPVKVPAGFKLTTDSGTDVTKGIVIEDVNAGDINTLGNQYVWVPIGDVKTDAEGKIITINLGRYNFDAMYNSETQQVEGTGEAELKQAANDYTNVVEIDTGTSYNFKETIIEADNITAKDLGDFITKAKNAGGYYIGRFEAGKVNENTDTFNIKKGQEVYNNITQSRAADLARNLYNGNSNFQSDLINSYAWNTAIVFIQTFSGDINYSKQRPLQTTLTETGNACDSNNNYDVKCNIFDISGNVCEWSTETSTNDANPCVGMGGSYYSNNFYVALRTGFSTNHFGLAVGFRSILYL